MSTETENKSDENSELITLRKHNADLNKDIKALKAQVQQLATAKEEAEENAKNANADELTKANNQIEKLNKTIEELTGRASSAEDNLRAYKTDNEISKLLVQHKVQNDDHDLVSTYLRSLTKWDDEGNLLAQDRPLADFAKEYFSGQGKRYIQMPDNSGGGSTGNDGTKPPRMTKETFNYTEFAKIALDNPAEANEIAEAIGKPELKTSL